MGEYFETDISALIFLIVGVLVWRLVNDLRAQENRLTQNLHELDHARERLLQEEKLAAVGRLSIAIAHEIRNPVAMISSSIATAKRLSGAEREGCSTSPPRRLPACCASPPSFWPMPARGLRRSGPDF